MGSIVQRLPLTLLLLICAVADLALRRIATPLVLASPARHGTAYKVVSVSGHYFFYLSGLLALAIFTWSAVVVIRDRNLLKIPQRMLFTLLAALFVPLAMMGITVDVPSFVAPHMSVVYGLFLLSFVVTLISQPAPLGAKLGVLYLTAPLLLRCYWRLTLYFPGLTLPELHDNLPTLVFQASEHLLVVGAYAIFLFFVPLRRRADLLRPVPLAMAVTITAGVAIFTRHDYETARQVVDLGLGLVLPEAPSGGLWQKGSLLFLLHLGGLFFAVLTLCTLAGGDRSQRGTVLGLAFIGLAGFHVQLPTQPLIYQFLLTLVGMMLIVRSALPQTADGASGQGAAVPTLKDWNVYLQHLARICSSPPEAGESVLLQTDQQHVGHVRGELGGRPYSVRMLVSNGALEQFEVYLGVAVRDPAPVSIQRKRGGRGRRVRGQGFGERVRAHDPLFDRQFVAKDSIGKLAQVLADDALRAQLQQRLHGWLGVWPGEGLRYEAAPARDGWPVPVAEVAFSPESADTLDIEQLLELLVALADELDD